MKLKVIGFSSNNGWWCKKYFFNKNISKSQTMKITS